MDTDNLRNSVLVSFEFMNIKFFELELDVNENLVEINQIILDHFFTNFYENISFFINNEVIDIMKPLVTYIKENTEGLLIVLKLINFDKKSSLNHIKRVKEFIKNPETFKSLCNFEFKINCCQINYNNIIESYNNVDIKKYLKNKVNNEEKIDYLSWTKRTDLNELEKWEKFINFEPLNRTLLKSFKLLKENEIDLEHRNNGFFYIIKVTTLEGKNISIGSNIKGFKDLQEKEYYCSLIKLLSKKSNLFEEYLGQINFDKINLDYLNSPLYLNNELFFDLKHDKNKNFKNYKQITDTKSYFNKHSFTNRDWNEEIQQAKSITLKNQLDNISKNRVIKKLQNEFLESFIKGIKLIGNKELIPFSLSNKDYDQCFLYNNIFFTYVMDSDYNSSYSGPNAITTTKISSADINNLSYINYYNYDGIHYVASAIADFKGKRILGQALIHGINNYDSNTWVKHGIIEESNKIISNPDFKKEIDKINKYFNLKTDLKYVNDDKEEVLISGSPEIKGILANDKRYYLLDLIRFQVRDLNWTEDKIKTEDFPNLEKFCNLKFEGNEEKKFGACLIRRELVNNYFLSEAFADYYKKIDEYKKNVEEKQAEDKKTEEKPIEEDKKTEEKPIEDDKKPEEKIVEEVKKPEENKAPEFKLSLKEKLFFNSTIETSYPSKFNSEEEKQEDIKNLEKLADFLLNKSIPNLVKDLETSYMYKIINNCELSKLMKKFGINNRYLGVIYGLFKEENFNSLLILKSLFLRSLKKYIRKVMREINEFELNSSLAYIFNLIFSDSNSLASLNDKAKANKVKRNNNLVDFVLNYDESGKILDNQISSKNKKNKRKYRNNFNFINDFTSLTSGELFEKIITIAKFYFKFEDKNNFNSFEDLPFFNSHKNKMNFLYELCTSLGIKIQQRDYKFCGLNQSEYPFKSNDFIDYIIKIKNPFSYNEEYKNIVNELNQMIDRNKINEAYEIIVNNLNLLLTINGVYNEEIINLMNIVNKILIKRNEFERALKYAFFILNVIKKYYGITNNHFALKLIEIGDILYFLKEDELCINFYLKAIIVYDLIGNENNIYSINLISEIEKIFSIRQIDVRSIFILPNEIKDNYSLLIDLLENCLKRIRNDKMLKFQINRKLFNYYLKSDKNKAIRLGVDQVVYLKKIENPNDQIKMLISDYKKVIDSLK